MAYNVFGGTLNPTLLLLSNASTLNASTFLSEVLLVVVDLKLLVLLTCMNCSLGEI